MHSKLRGRNVSALALLVAAGATTSIAHAQIFSLDIGSDRCSDPNGGQGFDPGDMYWVGDAVLPGKDGSQDDANFFGLVDPKPWYNTKVPFGSGGANNFFDLDGFSWIPMDAIGLGVGTQVVTWSGLTAQEQQYFTWWPVPFISAGTVLHISYDDDGASRWSTAAYEVPVQSKSPLRGRIYGTTLGNDEILSLSLVASLDGYPKAMFATGDLYGLASESAFCADLGLNPDVTEMRDDDVDALYKEEVDGPILFSADAEAKKGLNPGSIYQATPPAAGVGPWAVVELVNAQSDLKLKAGTDIDDFEMAWITHPTTGVTTLVCIFTVDDDDPTTAADESGGKEPNVIYASTMAGAQPFKLFEAASVMYGLDRTTQDLYRVDRHTGATVSLGVVPCTHTATYYPQMGAGSDGRLWVIDGDDLILVNPDDPASATVHATIADLSGLQVTDLTRSADPDLLYAVVTDLARTSYDLWEIEISTASATELHDTGLSDIWGIAFDPTTNDLYMVDEWGNSLWAMDVDTFALNDLGLAGVAGGDYFNCLALDSDGTMYSGKSELFHLDPGASPDPVSTAIGATGATLSALTIVDVIDDIDAIAIPEGQEGAAWNGGAACYADFEGDGDVDGFDLIAFIEAIHDGDPKADGDGNTMVDERDLACFIFLHGAGC